MSVQLNYETLYTLEGLHALHQAFGAGEDPLMEKARRLDGFLLGLFNIESEVNKDKGAKWQQVRVSFLRRYVRQVLTEQEAQSFSGKDLAKALNITDKWPIPEDIFASYIIDNFDQLEALKNAAAYAAWALYHPEGRSLYQDGSLFHLPGPPDLDILYREDSIRSKQTRLRHGFNLTDQGVGEDRAQRETHYCLKCHQTQKDSCRTGLREAPGCPLDQKISEMMLLAEEGYLLGALAVAMKDNPFVLGTGHRICNDCTKACIFQKQEGVDVPGVETWLVDRILAMPYGFEIISLLSRWNPLNSDMPLPQPPTGYKILVVGLGPAGYGLSHYLLRQGHQVVGIDGTKIDPLTIDPQLIKDAKILIQDLDQRSPQGFGGVAEYGITVRWNKNFLTLQRLILERNNSFKIFGGVRFGSQVSLEQAFELGFDHIALAVGAGRPQVLQIPGAESMGVHQASSFLMTLHLGRADQYQSVTSLTVRLPVVVIGAGLTAVDAATEALAYYPRQVLKFKNMYEQLVQKYGKEKVQAKWSDLDHEIAQEFIAHATLLEGASLEEQRRLCELWGGCRLVYRRTIKDASAYKVNYKELQKALEEGVVFEQNLTPQRIETDVHGWVKGLETHERGFMPAKTILTALGTRPNKALRYDIPELNMEIAEGVPFIHQTSQRKYVSLLGDAHPSYYGSVVKAFASAKHMAPKIEEALRDASPSMKNVDLEALWIPEVMESKKSDTIHQLTIKAPAAAQAFKPGYFYKIQTYGGKDIPPSEPIALMPIKVDKEAGTLTFQVSSEGGSRRLVGRLKKGDSCVLMGPLGSPLDLDPRKPVFVLAEPNNLLGHALRQTLRADGFQVSGERPLIQDKNNQIVSIGVPLDEDALHFVHAPLQCMMKEICASCVQTIVHPDTGEPQIIFACATPWVASRDNHISSRLKQNSLWEKTYDLFVLQ